MNSPSSVSTLVTMKESAALQQTSKGRVLVVEDEAMVRDSLEQLLVEKGYEVVCAENGKAALEHLQQQSHEKPQGERLPDIILLDLRMPLLDGWQFRAIQKDDPSLGRIPVIAFSADGSAKAAAISAQAYLRKPIEPTVLLATIDRVLLEHGRQMSERLDKSERFASLGRLAAGVGHEINNPLAFVMLNLSSCVAMLQVALEPQPTPPGSPATELAQLKHSLIEVLEMLGECQIGSERIRQTVITLQRLSRQSETLRNAIDVNQLIEESISIASNQLRHHARIVKNLASLPLICGNGPQIGQVFLNILLNAAHAIPEGDAEGNEIRISTAVVEHELAVEIEDSGKGIAPEILSHIFEPFFTTKAVGEGTGLGLSISRQTIAAHDGRITVESELGKRTVFRIFLPLTDLPPCSPEPEADANSPRNTRARILVIDDELLIGRVIRTTLAKSHVVVSVDRASEAIARLAQGEAFDVILCDLVMPDISGPEFHSIVSERWPHLLPHLAFMTG